MLCPDGDTGFRVATIVITIFLVIVPKLAESAVQPDALPALMENAADAEAGDRVTDAGTDSSVVLLVAIATVVLALTEEESVTVQEALADTCRDVALQVREDKGGVARTDRVKVVETPFREPVRTAVPAVVKLAAVASKVAAAAPSGMVRETGTVTAELLLTRETAVPPVDAGWFRVTVQAPAAPATNEVGVQVRPVSRMGACTESGAVNELVPSEAVSVPV